MKNLFIRLFAICISSVVRWLLRSLAHFLKKRFDFLLMNFKSSLYILGNCSSSDMSFPNIFSRFVTCLLILLILSYIEQKVLILMKSSWSIISFMNYAFGVLSKYSSSYPKSTRYSPVSSRSFTVLNFTYRSMIYIELSFVKGVKSVWIYLFSFACGYPILPAPFVEKCIFSPLCLCFFVKDQLMAFLWVYFWALYSISLIYLCTLLPITHCLHFSSFIVKSWSWVVSVLQCCSSIQYYVGLLDLLPPIYTLE